MNRQLKRMQAKQDRVADKQQQKAGPKARQQQAQAVAPKRVGARQFTREVAGEMRKVLWPSRQQVINSFVIVLVVVVVMTTVIWALDVGFQALIKWMYG